MKVSANRTRRGFAKACALMVGAPFVSRLTWAAGSPMQKLEYGAIGLGGRGMFDVQSILQVRQGPLCHPVQWQRPSAPHRKVGLARLRKKGGTL